MIPRTKWTSDPNVPGHISNLWSTFEKHVLFHCDLPVNLFNTVSYLSFPVLGQVVPPGLEDQERGRQHLLKSRSPAEDLCP